MKLSIEPMRKLFRLPPADRLLLGQSWIILLLVRITLHVLPFKAVRTFCERASRRTDDWAHTEARMHILRVTRLVEIAARYSPVEATCLTEALTLAWLLGRRGIATNVRIGVARRNSRVTAHAWLEREGLPIYGLSDENMYVPLLPVGPDARR